MAKTRIDLSQLSVADPVVSGRGAKSAKIGYLWAPGPMRVIFEPSAFNNEAANRVNLCFAADGAAQELDDLDSWVVNYVEKHSERLLGKKLTVGEVQNRYQPCLKRSDRYASSFKVKLTLEGPGRTMLWDADRQPCGSPQSWRQTQVTPLLKLKGLWFMSRDFGCLWEATDLMLHTPAVSAPLACPF
jgi:hypothetical protein